MDWTPADEILSPESDRLGDPDLPQMLAAWSRSKQRILPVPAYQRQAFDLLRETVSAAGQLSVNVRLDGADRAVMMEAPPRPVALDPTLFEARLEIVTEGARHVAEDGALSGERLREVWGVLEQFERVENGAGAASEATDRFWSDFDLLCDRAEERLRAGGAPDIAAAGLHYALLERAPDAAIYRFFAHLTPAMIFARWDAPVAAIRADDRALYGYALDAAQPLGLRRLGRLYAKAASAALQSAAAMHLPDAEADAFRRETSEPEADDGPRFSLADWRALLEAAEESVARLAAQLEMDAPNIERDAAMNAMNAQCRFETASARFAFGFMLPSQENAANPALTVYPFISETRDGESRTRLLSEAKIELFAAEDRAETRAFHRRALAFAETLLVHELLAATEDDE